MTDIDIEKVIAWISWILTMISNFRYNFGRSSQWDGGHQDDVAFTPFTADAVCITIYWVAVMIWQLVYLVQYFDYAPKAVNSHFIANNLLLLGWSYLFARGHYIMSEIVIFIALLNTFGGYLWQKSYSLRPLSGWVAVHVGAIVLPMTWALYVLFWNGAVMLHAKGQVSRLIANILIWTFLFVPNFFMIVFGDYAVGFANAWITFSIGVGQVMTKVFALQWIFAFIICGFLVVGSCIIAVFRTAVFAISEEDQAPLLVSRSVVIVEDDI